MLGMGCIPGRNDGLPGGRLFSLELMALDMAWLLFSRLVNPLLTRLMYSFLDL